MNTRYALAPRQVTSGTSPKRLASVVLAYLLAASSASALTGNWNIDNNTSGWGNSANWLAGVIPNGVDDEATFTFDITAARTVTLDGSRTLGSLTVGDPTGGQAYTLSANGQGGQLIFDKSVGDAQLTIAAAAGGAANAFNVPLVLNDSLNVHLLNTGVNQFNGNISGTGGMIFDASGTHPGGTASAVGQATLSGYNRFSGGLTIGETRVQGASGYSVGTGSITVNDGGQIYLTGAGFYSNNITINGMGWNEATHGALGAIRSDANNILTGTITLAGANNRIASNGNTTLINGVIGESVAGANLDVGRWVPPSGAGMAGTYVINHTTSATGVLSISSGTLRVGDSGTAGNINSFSSVAFGRTNTNAEAGGTANLEFRRSDNVTFTKAISETVNGAGNRVVGSLIHSGTGVLTFDNGANGYTGGTTANGISLQGVPGKLVFGNGGAYNFTGAGIMAMNNGADIEFRTSSNVTLNGQVTGVDTNPGLQTFLIWNSTGTLSMGGAGNNSGAQIAVPSGTVELNKTAAGVFAFGGNNQIGALITGGTLKIATGVTTDQIWSNSDIKLDSGTLDLNGRNDGFDVLTGSGGVVTNSGGAASVLTLGENNSTTNFYNGAPYAATYAGSLQNGAGGLGVTKTGTGLQTLSGASTYTGATTVSAGVLSVTGSLDSGGAVAVNNTGTLSGTGSVGAVTMAAGSSLRPGATNLDNATGTLTASALIVNGGDIRLNLGTANDLVNVTGAANWAAASTVTPIFNAPPALGTIPLVDAAGGVTLGVAPTLTIPATTRSTFALTPSGTSLGLTVSGAAAKSLVWNDANFTGAWNLNTTANFTEGGVSQTFFNLDAVTFPDAPYVAKNVALAAGLAPSSITVTNSPGNDYTFSAGSIAGGTGLTKSGNGMLTVSTANTFSGDVLITGGTLRAGNAAALGDVGGVTRVSGTGTLDVNAINLGSEQIYISGSGVGGNGALVNNSGTAQTQALRFVTLTGNATIGGVGRFDIRATGGATNAGETLDLAGNTLTKVGNNLFYIVNAQVTDGNIDVQGGQLGFALASQLVQGSGTITFNPGTRGIFYQTAGPNFTRNMVVNGATFDTEGQNSTVNSNIQLTGDLGFVNTANTLTLNGSLVESGGVRSLTKLNAGAVTLNGNNTFTGGITIGNLLTSGGTLNLGGANTVAGPVTINNGALQVLSTLQQTASLGNASSISLSPGAFLGQGGSTLRLNLANNYTLPPTSLSSLTGNVVNYNGLYQNTTLTINQALGATENFNTLNFEQGTVEFGASADVKVSQLSVGMASLATGNVGTLNVLPGASVNTRSFYIGEGGGGRTGFVNQTGGTVNVNGQDVGADGSFRLGHWNGSGAAYNLSGGTLNVPAATASIGIDGVNASLNVSGGTANFWKLQVDGRSATGPIGGSLNVSGGEVAIGDGGLSTFGNGQTNLSGGKLSAASNSTWSAGMNFVNNSATLDARNNLVTVSGALFGPGGFTKAGGGTMVLSSAASNLAGTVNANAGTLVVTGALNSAATTVNVNSGGMLLVDGTGANPGLINGTVNLDGGVLGGSGNGTTTGRIGSLVVASGNLRPGMSAGTLSVGTLTVNGGNTQFELDGVNTAVGGGINDLLAVTNGATFTGGTITPSFNSAPVSGNVYTLLTSGTLTGLPTVDPAAANSRLTYALGAAGNNVTLTVTGAAKALIWTGATNSAWDVNGTTNWTDGAAEKFYQADSVTFDGAAAGTITLAGSIQPISTTVTGASNYTFTGGSIDTGSLTKSGAGTLTLASPNSYTGGTNINGGTLSFSAGSLGTQGSITMGGGALQWNGANTEDVSGRLVMPAGTTAIYDTNGNNVVFASAVGSGNTSGLTKEGAGTLLLLNTATYTGATTVNNGTLQVGNNGTIGALNAGSAVSVNGAGKLTLFRSGVSVPFNNAVSGTGTLEFKGDGTFQNGDYIVGGNNAGLSGTVVVDKARVQVDNANDLGSASVNVLDGGEILVSSGTFNNPLTLAGVGWWEATSPFNLGALRIGGASTVNWAGPVTLAGDTRIHAHAAADVGTISGTIGGPGGLHKTGAGTVTLSGAAANTYGGLTIVDNGVLQAQKTAGVAAFGGNVQLGGFNTNQPHLRMLANEQFAPGATLTFANYFNNWTRFDLQGTTQTLAGLQGTLGGGVLQNERLGGGGTTAPGTLIINNSADYTYDGYMRDRDGGTSATIPLNLVKNGLGTQTLSFSTLRGNAQITYTGSTTVNEGTLKLVDTLGYNSPTTINPSGTLELNSSRAFAARWVLGAGASLNGTGTVNKTGTGYAYVSGAINFGGTINVLEGTFGNDNNATNWAASTANVNVSAGATFDSRADATTINSLNGAGTVTNSFGNVAGGNPVPDNFTVGIADGSGVFTGSITDGGGGSGEQRGMLNLVKAGAGTQVIAGNNTYSGTTTISGGQLRVGNGGTTGNLGGGDVANNASLVFDRADSLTTHNPISGTGTVTKEGAGTLTLTGNSTYLGATTISGGTVRLGASQTLPVANSLIWLDATDGSTINTGGGGITSWTNKGTLGGVGDATAVGGQEPIFVGSEPAMNNQPVIRFDATTPNGVAPFDRLTTGTGTDFTAGNVTVMYVGRMTGGANQRLLAGVGNNWLLGTWGTADNLGGGAERAYLGTNWVYQGNGWDTTARVYTGTFSNTGDAAFYVNGVSRATGAGLQGPAGLSLGGGFSGNPVTEFSDADIGELLVFNGVLSAEDRRAIEAYLARKWQNGNTNILPATTALSLTVSGTTLDINGTNQRVGSTSGVAGALITLGGGNFTSGDSTSTEFAGNITGLGNVTKEGAGTWTLSGTNTIDGAITINAGTLSITGTTTSGGVDVVAGATLAGTGTVAVPSGFVTLYSGSLLSPGTGPGNLEFDLGAGVLDINLAVSSPATGALLFELGVPGTDVVTLTSGTLELGLAGLEFDDFAFTAGSGFGPGVYTLFDGTLPFSGTLGANLTGVVDGYSSTISSANGGQDIILTVVPEPSSTALFSVFALMLCARRRRPRSISR